MADLLYLMGFKDTPSVGAFEVEEVKNDLHLTILNNFNIPSGKIDEARVKFDRAISFFGALELQVEGEDTFTSVSKESGEIKYIPVLKISGSDKLGNTVGELHSTLAAIVLQCGGSFNNGEYIFDNYSPHISYAENLNNFSSLETLSLVHHRGGFGVDVVNYYNYRLNSSL